METLSLESALGFIDLRGFTKMSERLPTEQVLISSIHSLNMSMMLSMRLMAELCYG